MAGLADQHTRELRATAAEVTLQRRRHRRECYACRPGEDDTLRWCDVGWELAKAELAASRAVTEDQAADTGPAAGLW